jgi:hypothetical protein
MPHDLRYLPSVPSGSEDDDLHDVTKVPEAGPSLGAYSPDLVQLATGSHKLFGSSMAFLTDPLTPDNRQKRPGDDCYIQEEADALHVLKIQVELLPPGQAVAAAYLSEASYARSHVVAAPLLGGIAREVLDE